MSGVFAAVFLGYIMSCLGNSVPPDPPLPLPTEHSALLRSAQGSMQRLRDSLTLQMADRDVDFQLVEQVQFLQKQVASLSALITSLDDKLNSVTEATLRVVTDISMATKVNKNHLDVVWQKLNSLTPPKEVTRQTGKREVVGRDDTLMLSMMTNLTRSCKVAVSTLAARVVALERYASPTDGALVNASKLIGGNLARLNVRLVKMAASQGAFNKNVANVLKDKARSLLDLEQALSSKQNQLVVEAGSKLLKHKVLNTTVRLDFKKKFTQKPEVFVALSGFAMDPDQVSFKTEKEPNKIRISEHSPLVYTVQTNFYAARIEYSGVDLTGFSIRVTDGRELRYSAYQWVQVEYLALGE